MIDPCGNVHRNEGIWGGSRLHVHFAPRWAPLTRSLPEPDKAYYIQSQGKAKKDQPPDLAYEVVVSHSEKKALRAGAFLRIPELWVFDIPRERLTFYHLALRGKQKGTYRPQPRSRAFPMLLSAEVLERLDPETEDMAFLENCRAWTREVLVPRLRAD